MNEDEAKYVRDSWNEELMSRPSTCRDCGFKLPSKTSIEVCPKGNEGYHHFEEEDWKIDLADRKEEKELHETYDQGPPY
jgi:predicted Zn-ribbon and HTH transcriptional regulator